MVDAEQVRSRLRDSGQHGDVLGRLLVELSWRYRVATEFELATERAREAIDLGKQTGDAKLEADGYNALGGVNWRRGDFSLVWEHWLRALRLRESVDDQAGMAASYSNLGLLLDSEGDFPGALEYYHRALSIDREIGSPPLEIAATINNIGSVHEQLGEPEVALRHHEESLAIRLELGDRRAIGTSYNNLGASLVDMGRWEEARKMLHQALELREAIEDLPGQASTLGELAKLERLVGRVNVARDFAARGLTLYQKIEEPWGQADVSNQWGEIELAAGKPSEALSHFDEAKLYAEQIGAPLLLADQWDGRARAWEALSQWEDAVIALREHATLREKITGDSARRRIELLEIRHETQRKELEVGRLTAANQQAEGALRQVRFERRTMIGGLAALVVFLLALAVAYRWQHKVTAELSAAHHNLQELSAQKDRFLQIVAHDLRSPLGNIRWLSGLLREPQTTGEELVKTAGMIDQVAEQLIDTTDKLLDVSRIEAGSVELTLTKFDLSDLVSQTAARWTRIAEGKGQQLRWLSGGLSAVVHNDAGLVQQVLDNLISNAIKFTPINGEVSIGLEGANGSWCVRVTDSGPGIPDAAREHLFSQFSRVGNVPTAGEDSHGLGLAIASGLAEVLGGKLGLAKSTSNLKGACFEFCLPVETDRN
ncbi:tetratricopeptide repeat-containing sensor histidine kinase [Synoicihabitans lomoniglobus]|uniref:histidine kinase n=1 Tax=Synoicihabitans lomoniglobus TaxID=2909285 RepID=A0AAF0CSX4_9BACT|nr:tetratricopeptide repeat-containing sensor histidine kinase [Opitutaceae bacterium LMO-M01]WED67509.1 tetratricopeptide repeat-containing sensor histidine kinase [Opitutaceae bacterium LMO-M01]